MLGSVDSFLSLLIAWGVLLAWPVLQVYALFRLRGLRLVISLLPLAPMYQVLRLTYAAYQSQSNLWPILLIFAGPAAAVWVSVCLIWPDSKPSK